MRGSAHAFARFVLSRHTSLISHFSKSPVKALAHTTHISSFFDHYFFSTIEMLRDNVVAPSA